MNVDTKLREASESVRQARRQAQFTSRSPSRRHLSGRGPILAAAVAFVLVAVVALPAFLLPASDDPGNLDVASSPPPSSQLGAIGGDGPYLAVDESGWALDHAWQIDSGDGSSFVLYENGNRQISIMTGEVAEEAITEANELDGTKVDDADAIVDVYHGSEGVSYVWKTSDGTSVVVTFGQMSIDDAENLAKAVITIDEETFADMVATSPVTTTTIATQNTDS